MRLACAALVFGLLVLQKDPDGEPPLDYRPWPDGLCGEQSGLWCLRGTFCWQPDLCWVTESPWGSCLAGVAMVLLWALLESWAASCLASPQTPPAGSAVPLETETARQADVEIPRTKSSRCLCGQPSTSGLGSYDQPSERRRRSSVTFEGPGKRRRGEVLYSEYRRSRSSSSSTQRSLQDRSSSPSSSSSSSFSFCLPHLKNLDFLCAPGDSSSAKCSLETVLAWKCGAASWSSGSESEGSDTCYVPHDDSSSAEEESLCSQAGGKPAPRGSLLLLEKCSETESVSLSLRPREVQTQTSFASFNIIQSSAYKKDNRVFLVEKSLQVQMGAVRLPKALPPLPKLILTGEVGKRGKPATLSVLALTSLQHTDKARKCKRVASLCGLLGAFEKAVPKGSSQSRECSGLNAFLASASPPDGFARVPSVMETVDQDTRDFLEFHVQKKMVQWKCGMPSVVAKSVAAFQSPPSLCRDKPASDSRTATETIMLTSKKHVSLALRSSRRLAEGTYSLVLRSSRHLAVGIHASEGPKETSILSFLISWEPEDVRRLAFHTAVKRLEIKMGAFPEMVGNSFQLFRGLSKKPLPKVIRSGNKMLKSKHPLLPFLAQENICVLELNIRRKCFAYAGHFSIVYTRLTTTRMTSAMTPVSSRRHELKEELRVRMVQLLVSIWRQIHTVEISRLGLNQRLPLPQRLPRPLDSSASPALPSFCAAESPDAQFQIGPSEKLDSSASSPFLSLSAEESTVAQFQIGPSEKLDSSASSPFLSLSAEESTVAQLQIGPSEKLDSSASSPFLSLSAEESTVAQFQIGPSEKLDSSASSPFLSLSAEESTVAQLQIGLLKKLVAHQVPADTPRPPEEQPLVEGRGDSPPQKPPERGPGLRALPSSFEQPDPKSAASRKAMKFRAEASIVRTSILLELELKKEKLNLHLKKKMRAQLQPPQGAGLEITIQPRRKARGSPAPRQAGSSAQPLGRPRRSFCYVCMPSEESGTELKTVCWSLPRWILEMNGYRTPEVARFAGKSRTPQPVQK